MFEWGDGAFRTTQWVGVVQVPGLQLEILPKIDLVAAERSETGDLPQTAGKTKPAVHVGCERRRAGEKP